MENYFEMLDLSPTTTLEEISRQYELLMRIYHPGRFADPVDKKYAEHKCAELTRAYQALTSAEDWLIDAWGDETTLPRVEPALVDWGTVNQGDRLAVQLYIHPRRPVQRLRLTPDRAAHWLYVGRSERMTLADREVLTFGVTVNTERLEIGKRYIGQIKAEIDRVPRYVFLMMQIDPPCPDLYANHRWLEPDALPPRYWRSHALQNRSHERVQR